MFGHIYKGIVIEDPKAETIEVVITHKSDYSQFAGKYQKSGSSRTYQFGWEEDFGEGPTHTIKISDPSWETSYGLGIFDEEIVDLDDGRAMWPIFDIGPM